MKSTQQPMIYATLESEVPPPDDLRWEKQNDKWWNEKDSNMPETNDDDLGIDYEADFSLRHSILDRKIQAIYDNGWFSERMT